jgi:hypothetical protein
MTEDKNIEQLTNDLPTIGPKVDWMKRIINQSDPGDTLYQAIGKDYMRRYVQNKTNNSEWIKYEFIIPDEIPKDIFKLEPKDWLAWMRQSNWNYEGCYHEPDYCKEVATGISRRSGRPVPNPLIDSTWEDLGDEYDSRYLLIRGMVQTFHKWLRKSAKK